MTKTIWAPKSEPHIPPDYDKDVIYAWRALKEGKATPDQQGLIVQYIAYVTGTGDWADIGYRPGGVEAERASAFADGKKSVGLALEKLGKPYTLQQQLKHDNAGVKPAEPKEQPLK